MIKLRELLSLLDYDGDYVLIIWDGEEVESVSTSEVVYGDIVGKYLGREVTTFHPNANGLSITLMEEE